MKSVRVFCPAKINLTLEILGKRPDGYHELRTIFQAVGLCDELTVTPAERDALTVTGLSGAPSDESNLCLRALDLFRREVGADFRIAVTLHKRIPMQAGLGGGSSDGAGMLAALCRLAGLESPSHLLARMAAQLGSDMPFFLHGGAMLGAGRGEVLEPIAPLASGAFVLVKPDVGVNTAQAYGLMAPDRYTDGSHTADLAACLASGCALPELAEKLYNVFAGPVESLHPEIAAVRQRLLTLHAQAALLCGSGAAVFGLYENTSRAEQAAATLSQEGLWAVAAQPLSHGLQVTEI